MALTVFSHSHYGYCKSYCRIDYVIPYAVVGGMVTPPDEIEFTNTISGVLCISDNHVGIIFGSCRNFCICLVRPGSAVSNPGPSALPIVNKHLC